MLTLILPSRLSLHLLVGLDLQLQIVDDVVGALSRLRQTNLRGIIDHKKSDIIYCIVKSPN